MLLEKADRPGGEWPPRRWIGQYILDDDNNPVPCDDILVWGRFMESDRRRVGGARFGPAWMRPWSPTVSTMFLGLDHGMHDGGPPILFETMIFGHHLLRYSQTRCATWAEAEVMHEWAALQTLAVEGILLNTIANFAKGLAREFVLAFWTRPPWRYWRDRLLNRYVIVTIDGVAHKAFVRSRTVLQIVGTKMGSVTITTNFTAGLPGTAPRGVDKWASKFSSAASRTRSALSKLSSIRFGRTRRSASRSP